jgi:hypothetical protein
MIVLAVFSAAIFLQTEHLALKDFRFELENRVSFKLPGRILRQGPDERGPYRPFLSSVQQLTDTNTASFSPVLPGYGKTSALTEQFSAFMDENYLETFQVPLIAGRGFDEGLLKQWASIDNPKAVNEGLRPIPFILSESMARKLDLPEGEEAIGSLIPGDALSAMPEKMRALLEAAHLSASGSPAPAPKYEVIGIIPDQYHFWQPDTEPVPAFYLPVSMYIIEMTDDRWLTVAFDGDRQEALLDRIRLLWQQHFPGATFEPVYPIEDMRIKQKPYVDRLLFVGFVLLVVMLVAGAGLFALAGEMAERRRFEMAIRKVFGNAPIMIAQKFAGSHADLLGVGLVRASWGVYAPCGAC